METGRNQIPEISIICCYRDTNRWDELSSQAVSLSSSAIELIGINNTSNSYTLPDAYNQGRDKAQGEILFFVHDDVSILIENWDALLKSVFEKLPDCGVLGFAGGTSAFSAPSTWWTKAGNNKIYRNMVRPAENGGFKVHQDTHVEVEVIGLDGFALAVRRELVQDFDWSNSIGKWHGYDLDLCYHMYFKKKRKNYVIPHVMVRHSSLGTINRDWGKSMIQIWLKYYEQLEAQSSKIDNLEGLTIFINCTHQDFRFIDFKRAAVLAKLDSLLILLTRLCYSRTHLIKKVGFRLLSWYK